MNRSRNLWSVEEDTTLRRLVESCEKGKVDWRVIASYLPGRNNKDCRKRWHYRVSATMNLGPWAQSEDELLKMGIHRHGTHWSRVAQVVGTRNGDQCFKRWNDVLDPAIDRSPWTRDEDRILLLAIGEYGRAWKMIVDTYFPGRTGLDAKNRHHFHNSLRHHYHPPYPPLGRQVSSFHTTNTSIYHPEIQRCIYIYMTNYLAVMMRPPNDLYPFLRVPPLHIGRRP
ncbi:DNA-binding protein [Talaromyces pinophilus]|uniref:DNA-binding protein n=1 Tax=Talaromyces pinophilus TaxID=128442 RepID=A0A6V8HH66_TALPI|nr:Hypothetical protein PENO1_056460 [Penicillium occitanis (nom. inval.)]PCG99467.1 hypothetical protein PENOC_057730 [Penicillium occitanis (nom. inval.)]GAM40805.1 DNA-binding protein [Talaromyces pinophilus]